MLSNVTSLVFAIPLPGSIMPNLGMSKFGLRSTKIKVTHLVIRAMLTAPVFAVDTVHSLPRGHLQDPRTLFPSCGKCGLLPAPWWFSLQELPQAKDSDLTKGCALFLGGSLQPKTGSCGGTKDWPPGLNWEEPGARTPPWGQLSVLLWVHHSTILLSQSWLPWPLDSGP